MVLRTSYYTYISVLVRTALTENNALKSSRVTTLDSDSNTYCKEYIFTYESSSGSRPCYRISCTVADMNALNITTTEEEPKQEDEEDEEDEEEEFVKYGAVDEFYELEKEIGK